MLKLVILFVLTSFAALTFAQSDRNNVKYNQSEGAVNIFEDGDFQIQFLDEKNGQLPTAYPSLSSMSSPNVVWVSYIAEQDGELTFNASKKTGYVQMVVFEEGKGNIYDEIKQGASEIKRLYTGTDQSIVGLDYKIGDGVLYSLPMVQGRKILVMFVTEEGSKDKLQLQWHFVPKAESAAESKIVDRRDDDFAPVFSIIVKDEETNLPLIASITIQGNKTMDGLYTASELYFNIDRNVNLSISIEVEGYFFEDIEKNISANEDTEMEVMLDRVSSGKSMQIEEIEFVPGTSEITKSSEPKLKRLLDFLILNSELNVEIQGHVFAVGDNSFAGQKISEARAKRVMKYLVDNGVEKDRLSAVGYGNTRPIYPEPKFYYEEQANRRVEVVIK